MKTKVMILLVAFVLGLPIFSQAAIIANIGEIKVSDEQIKNDYDSITKEQRKAINDDETTRLQIVNNAINTEVIVMAAKKIGLDKDADYAKALEKFQKQYLATKFIQKTVESKLGKSEIKKYFEANKAFFDNTKVCAHHIVVKDEKDANKIAAEAKAKGSSFEALAKKSSIDPTVQENKGNLGCFTRDQMVPEFSMAAFDMLKGEVRGPVRTMYGFHIIKLDDIKVGKTPEYDEVEQRVKESFRLKLVNDLVQDLRAKSNVKINEDEVKKFKM